MSILSDLTADIRARSGFIAACPLCSFLNRPDGLADLVRYPTLDASRRNGRFSLMPCCELSKGSGWHESAADVAAWWREKRAQPLESIALDNRRKSTLARLAAAGLEPIVAQSEVAA